MEKVITENFGMYDAGIVESKLRLIEEKIRAAWDTGLGDDEIDALVAEKHRMEGRLETLENSKSV